MSPLIPLIGTRLVYGLGTLFIVSLVVFFAVELLPGDVAAQILGRDATPESLALLRERLGLGQPGVLRYLDWLGGMVTGEMGNSLVTGKDISNLIRARLANTLFLAAFAAAVAIPLALCLGVLAALYRDSLFDRTVNVLTLAAISLPEFFIAYILVMLLSIGVQVHLAAPLAVAALLVLPAALREAWRQRSQGAVRLAVAVALLLVLLNGVFHIVPLTVPPVRLLPSLSRIPDADLADGDHRLHDAHDPRQHREPARLALYRNGRAEGCFAGPRDLVACPAQCPSPNRKRCGADAGLSNHRGRRGRGGLRLSRTRAASS